MGDMIRKTALMFVVLAAALGAFETGASLVATGQPGFGLPAEAIVGRPLTPVSVAGVARRSVRRCAATVVVC
jgi:hypothetical protein